MYHCPKCKEDISEKLGESYVPKDRFEKVLVEKSELTSGLKLIREDLKTADSYKVLAEKSAEKVEALQAQIVQDRNENEAAIVMSTVGIDADVRESFFREWSKTEAPEGEERAGFADWIASEAVPKVLTAWLPPKEGDKPAAAPRSAPVPSGRFATPPAPDSAATRQMSNGTAAEMMDAIRGPDGRVPADAWTANKERINEQRAIEKRKG